MTVVKRQTLAAWRLDGIEQAASNLDEVRSAFLDAVGLAKSAPDRSDPTWAGHAADACRERLLEEVEAARKLALELEDVADILRGVGRRLEHAKAFVQNVAGEIESDLHGLVVHDDWEVNISPMALVPTSETDPARVREAIIERQEQMNSAVRFLAEEDMACAELLAEAMEHTAHYGRRLDQAAAFERATGRSPDTANDWLTASMLDATSEIGKYDGTDAQVVVGHIRPQPGMGVVRTELYIPVHSVFNFALLPPALEYDLGDLRGANPTPTPGDARVELVIDYDNGLIVARQNPSVTESGEVRVDAPIIDVQQLTTGDVRIAYEAANPFAPAGGEPVHKVQGEIAVSPDGGEMTVGGIIGEYPSLEMYHHQNDGTVVPLAIEDAQDRTSSGPLWNLPRRQDIGDPSVIEPFEDMGNPTVSAYEGGLGQPSHPGETRLGSPEDDVQVPSVTPTRGGR